MIPLITIRSSVIVVPLLILLGPVLIVVVALIVLVVIVTRVGPVVIIAPTCSIAGVIVSAVIRPLIIIAVTLYYGVGILSQWRRLRHVPGPPSAGFSKWWLLRNTLQGNLHLRTKEACSKYGQSKYFLMGKIGQALLLSSVVSAASEQTATRNERNNTVSRRVSVKTEGPFRFTTQRAPGTC